MKISSAFSKNIIRNTLAAVFLLGVSIASAAGKWTDWTYISQVYSYSNETVFILLKDRDKSHVNPAGCTGNDWLAVRSTQANKDHIVKLALTAQSAGLRVNMYISGNECGGTRPIVSHVRTWDP